VSDYCCVVLTPLSNWVCVAISTVSSVIPPTAQLLSLISLSLFLSLNCTGHGRAMGGDASRVVSSCHRRRARRGSLRQDASDKREEARSIVGGSARLPTTRTVAGGSARTPPASTRRRVSGRAALSRCRIYQVHLPLRRPPPSSLSGRRAVCRANNRTLFLFPLGFGVGIFFLQILCGD
jgi:hypothetical protein